MRPTLPVLALAALVALGCKPQPKATSSNTDPQNPNDAQFQRALQFSREYRTSGRCKNASIRVAEDPDDDYDICYGPSPLYGRNAYLKEFKARFGPDLATIRRNCPSILAQVQTATAGKKLDELERLSPGYAFFCTDTPFS
jgi:hypothetical protein